MMMIELVSNQNTLTSLDREIAKGEEETFKRFEALDYDGFEFFDHKEFMEMLMGANVAREFDLDGN